ncbi:MAG: Crp/Fnr family transcriptional regulator [Bacteroidota bacterium]
MLQHAQGVETSNQGNESGIGLLKILNMRVSKSNTKEVFRNVLKQYNLDQNDVSLIMESFDELSLKKGDFFCKKGSYCPQLGILINGYLVARYERYNNRKNDSEIITSRFYLMPELPRNLIVCDFNSFFNNEKSNENIIAEENSQLVVISKDNLEKLYDKIPNMNRIGRIFAEQSYINAMDRIHILQSTGIEKIQHFLSEFRDVWKKAKINDIASYLGMERSSLRKELKKINK